MKKHSAAGLAVLLLLATTAFAHALLLESAPAANTVVSGSEIDVQLRFNTRIDAARSRLNLVFPNGTIHQVATMEPTSADVLRGRLNDLPRGAYRLRWQVLALDGHITRGDVPFWVK